LETNGDLMCKRRLTSAGAEY